MAGSAAAAQAPATPSRLRLETIVADTLNYNVVSTLIAGPTEILLFDAQNRMSDGRRVAERIAATGLRLKAIFLSHADEDHFFGALAVLERFPGTPVYMTPAALREFGRVAEGMRKSLKPRMGAEAPDSLIHPEAVPASGLAVDGEPLEVLPDLQGDVLEPSNSAIWIPSLRAVLAGDIVFNGVYPYLAASSEASRAAWLRSLDKLASLQPRIVVAGHKRSAEAADSPESLQFMRNYLADFEAARRSAPDVPAMIAAVRTKYPDLHAAMLLAYSARMTFGK
jgi:glyoxylase-like metal-dependent hydrolase (beta-lactamase superfamily II)